MTTSNRPPWITYIGQALTICLCNTISEEAFSINPSIKPVCGCCFRWSQDLPPMDACDCTCMVGDPAIEGNGHAWVRFVGASRPPTVKGCAAFTTVTFQMGIYRCVTGMDDDGNPPSCEQLMTDATLLMNDAQVLYRAAFCCDDLAKWSPALGPLVPVGPLGNCAGNALTVTLQVP